MSHGQLRSKDQSHLPPSQRLEPTDVPFSPSEQEAINAAVQGETWLCHGCEHGVVVEIDGSRGKRVFCALVRSEMRSVRACSKYEKPK